MSRNHSGTNIERSEFYGALQRIVDALFDDLEPVAPDFPAGSAAAPSSEFSPSIAERLGVSDRSAALLGLSAFDGLVPHGAASASAVEFAVGSAGAPDAAPASASSFATGDVAPAPVPGAALEEPTVRRLDVVICAEAADLPDDLMRIVNLLPPGDYTRQRLCDQINSAITGHAWGQVYGTVA